MARSKNKMGGIVVGPVIIFFSVLALWKNEGRFDYYRAAKNTTPIVSLIDQNNGGIISYTGPIDSQLTIPGNYVDSFIGQMMVRRTAEIYAWDRDEDDEGHVSWSMEWMGNLQSNSRNNGVRQSLSSHDFILDEYQVGELTVDSNSIEFVDSYEPIPVSQLTISPAGIEVELHASGEYLSIKKKQASNLGDERVSYKGIPIASTTTYFGKLEKGRGVRHQAVERGGFLDGLIQDTGILHHIVSGERDVALKTMKSHLRMVKWLFRGVGVLATIIGFSITFSSIVGILYHIPFIGPIVQWGVAGVSVVLGLTLSVLTIIASFLFYHPITLVLTLLIVGILFYWLQQRAVAKQKQVKSSLDKKMGHSVGEMELEELEFVELVKMALLDQKVDVNERKHLAEWARKHGWDKDKMTAMVAVAKNNQGDLADPKYSEKHLKNLIQLGLADGNLSAFEWRTISKAADEIGLGRMDVQRLIYSIQQTS